MGLNQTSRWRLLLLVGFANVGCAEHESNVVDSVDADGTAREDDNFRRSPDAAGDHEAQSPDQRLVGEQVAAELDAVDEVLDGGWEDSVPHPLQINVTDESGPEPNNPEIMQIAGVPKASQPFVIAAAQDLLNRSPKAPVMSAGAIVWAQTLAAAAATADAVVVARVESVGTEMVESVGEVEVTSWATESALVGKAPAKWYTRATTSGNCHSPGFSTGERLLVPLDVGPKATIPDWDVAGRVHVDALGFLLDAPGLLELKVDDLEDALLETVPLLPGKADAWLEVIP